MPVKNYYEILGVSKTSTLDEIKDSYKKLAIKFHPDKNPNNKEAEDKFKEIAEAYDTLGDIDKKKVYDSSNSTARTFNMFKDIFGGPDFEVNLRTKPMPQPPKGSDIKTSTSLTLKEILNDITKQIIVKRNVRCPLCDSTGAKTTQRCSKCDGTGKIYHTKKTTGAHAYGSDNCTLCYGSCVEIKEPCFKCEGNGYLSTENKINVKIPAGIEDGDILTLKGMGNSGFHGGPFGELLIEIFVSSHENIERKGIDLIIKHDVNISDLVLGTNIKVSTLTDETIEIKIPKGTQSGTKFRIKEKGLKKGTLIGNLYVIVNVIIPTNLTEDQSEIFYKIREIENFIKF